MQPNFVKNIAYCLKIHHHTPHKATEQLKALFRNIEHVLELCYLRATFQIPYEARPYITVTGFATDYLLKELETRSRFNNGIHNLAVSSAKLSSLVPQVSYLSTEAI